VGRSGPGEEARRVIESIQAAGAQVMVVQADVSVHGDVARVLAEIRQRLPPLRGIVHAAAGFDDFTRLEPAEQGVRRVFGPKAHGACHLHAQTQGAELDFFVLYSSAAALMGSPGQSNYAAANAFLDALAHERQRQGRAAMSIQWGAFAEVGLAAAQ